MTRSALPTKKARTRVCRNTHIAPLQPPALPHAAGHVVQNHQLAVRDCEHTASILRFSSGEDALRSRIEYLGQARG